MKISKLILTLASIIAAATLYAQQTTEPARTRIITYENHHKALNALADSSAYYTRLENVSGVIRYRDDFFFPFRWVGRALFLHFEGMPAPGKLYINEELVGEFTDSRGHSEFDITKFAQEGNNSIRIEFTGSDILTEAADFDANNTGIAYLTSEPKIRIRDLSVQTKINQTNGALQLGAVVKSHFGNPKKINVHFALYSPDGKELDVQKKNMSFENFSQDTVWFSTLVREVDMWSADAPLFYTAVLSVEYEGFRTQFVSTKIGFREVTFTDKELAINGKVISLGNVVEIPFRAEYALGEAESTQKIEALLKDLKSRGVKVVMPMEGAFAENFYNAADNIGMYVVDQAAFNPTKESMLHELPQYSDIVTHRVSSRFLARRNHPCVVAFSMGNSQDGFNLCEAYLEIKKLGDSRPIFAENVRNMWNSDIYFTRDGSTPKYNDRPVLNIESLNAALSRAVLPQPIVINELSGRNFEIVNNTDFIDLRQYKVNYTVLRGDKLVKSGAVSLTADSGKQQFRVPLEDVKLKGKKPHTLNLEVVPVSHGVKNLHKQSFALN